MKKKKRIQRVVSIEVDKLMGLIREPLDVDFYVVNRPLTDKDRRVISEYIQNCKRKKRIAAKNTRNRKKAKTTA